MILVAFLLLMYFISCQGARAIVVISSWPGFVHIDIMGYLDVTDD
jgi:hypothetical protein